MKRQRIHIIIGLLIIGLVSCIGIKTIKKTDYIGNFQENKFDFFETFQHTVDKDFYYLLPFDLKFGGIRPFPYDTVGKKDFSWLRNPKNLIVAFNTVKSIGLDRFVSIEQYYKLNNEWCCNTQWENKSLNEIVKEFINSDTISTKSDYFSKFWNRRRNEENLNETYQILVEIDKFYNKVNTIDKLKYGVVDTVLLNLLDFDLKLTYANSSEYSKISLEYFDYLKSVKLNYSAYKLIFHNKRLNFEKNIKDSLLMTMKYDTLSIENWENMDGNREGWITWELYRDTNRYYGP